MTAIPSEDWEQTQFVNWLTEHGYKHSAIPNHTYTTSWNQKRKNKQLGLHAGLPDVLVIAGGKVIWVEMKRLKDSYPTPTQKEWIAALNAAGTPATVARGHEAAIAFVLEQSQPEVYLGNDERRAA